MNGSDGILALSIRLANVGVSHATDDDGRGSAFLLRRNPPVRLQFFRGPKAAHAAHHQHRRS